MGALGLRREEGRTSRALGWAIATCCTAHAVITVQMPRTDKMSVLRESLRGWHYLLGTVVFVLAAWRLWRWWKERPSAAPAGLGAGAHHFARQLALATYLALLAMPVLGVLYGWHDGRIIHLGPFLSLPALVAPTRSGWMFYGYFHSAIGFVVTLITFAAALTGLYTLLRHGRGLIAAFPAGFGAQVYGSLLVSAYALASFRSPGPGRRAVVVILAITLAAWLASRWLAARRRHPVEPDQHPGGGLRLAALATTLGLCVLGAYAPHAMFRVTPWPVGEVIEVAGGVTSHEAPVVEVTVRPETAFDRRVREETYKWCRFCHTVDKGAPHLVGPNLYAIFGQRAGTAPNFYYSKAMAEAGRNGLVWNDETLAKFLAGPDRFIHGTSMIISSGPVRTPEERAAVIAALKRETMPGAIVEVP